MDEFEPYVILSLNSEKEIFGFSEEEMIIVELLKKCEIPGKYIGDKLEVFQHYGLDCPLTDLALLQGGIKSLIYTTTPVKNNQSYIITYSPDGKKSRIGQTERTGVIRPVLKIPTNINLEKFSDFAKIEYGEYPQFAANYENQLKLERELQNGSEEIEETNETYNIELQSISWPESEMKPKEYKVYKYEGKKYIRIEIPSIVKNYKGVLSRGVKMDVYNKDYCWIEVSPIIWLLDKKSRKLISEKGIISNISFMEDFRHDYTGHFTDSQVYKFLSKYFLPEMIQALSKEKTIDIENSKTVKM